MNGADSLRPRKALRALIRWAIPILVVAAVVFAVVLATTDETRTVYRASGAVELTDGGATSQRGAAVVEAERLFLLSDEFRTTLDTALGPTASQVDELDIVAAEGAPVLEIIITADTEDVAVEAVGTAQDEYQADRIDRQLVFLQDEIDAVTAAATEHDELVDELEAELRAARQANDSEAAESVATRLRAAAERQNAFDRQLQELQVSYDTADGRSEITSTATRATARTEGRSPLATAGISSLLVALLLALVVVLVDLLTGRVRMVEELKADFGDLPVLATIPRFRRRFRKGQDSIVTLQGADARRELEAFRFLRNSLVAGFADRSTASVAFTSSRPDEGKTVTCINTGIALAGDGHPTLLVDTDLARQGLTALATGSRDRSTLASLIRGTISPEAAVMSLRGITGSVDILASAPGMAQSAVPLDLTTEAVRDVLGKVKLGYRYVVIDTPPVLAVSDSLSVAAAADATVLVVRLGGVKLKDVRLTVERLRQVGANLVGFVVTHVKAREDSYYAYGGYDQDVSSGFTDQATVF